MTRRALFARIFALAAATALMLGACGGGDATPTVIPSPTPTTRAAPTPTAAPAPTATAAPAATSTVAPTAAPTPTPAGGPVATPIVNLGGKRGGTLQLSTFSSYLEFWDTLGSLAAVPLVYPLVNSLIWPDPYSPTALVGDVAERWDFGDDGKVITFQLRRGVTFQDGKPLTAKDVAYDLERAWKPTDPRAAQLKAQLQALQKVETLDDYTVRLTLGQPSNFFLTALSTVQFVVYPAHVPFPQWAKTPVGSGPFKFKSETANVKREYVRNDDYFRKGLPNLDGITITAMEYPIVLASFRTGKLDAVNLDYAAITNSIDVVEREAGFKKYPLNAGVYGIYLNQKPPFTDARVREAISLALNHQELVDIWLQGNGNAYGVPLLPPELGGRWGLSIEDVKNRPGFRQDKREDLARAKQLLSQAGIDPAQYSLSMIGTSTTSLQTQGEVIQAAFKSIGLKLNLNLTASGEATERKLRGDYDVHQAILSLQVDDPTDPLGKWVTSGGVENIAKWVNPRLEALFPEQDRTLDPAKRKQMLTEIQETVLKDNTLILGVWRQEYNGHLPSVKNFPFKLPFTFSPRFRWEQVWLER